MELWAGFECTRNRVGDRYHDQSGEHNRAARLQCLNALSSLGVKAFRYRIAWDDPNQPMEQAEKDIPLLAAQQVNPIIGLLHHGSGPPHTSLLSPDFAAGLAAHARQVAERFPHVRYWTPINEPLTTARFSALYGHWYPHHRNERDFWLALINQIDATRLAMREIRKVNPQACLIQTEDLGKTYATAALADQAAFDNQRRWMAWDLLTGRVVPGHPFYDRLSKAGFSNQLDTIADDPCPPAIIGIDHYLTSDRFLDHRIAHYPPHCRGGNGIRRFADIEAVRSMATPPDGLATALSEAWDRYKIPVAITECHNGCTREEQMRWFRDAWDDATELNKAGKQIIAVTSWAMLGASNWSSLATEDRGDFESGAFDPRGGNARPTGVAAVIKAAAQDANMPLTSNGKGWWRRTDRLHYRPVAVAQRMRQNLPMEQTRPLLIAGATGTLGQALLGAARARGLYAVATSRAVMTLDCAKSVAAAIERYQPWAVINACGWVRVDEAEAHIEACNRSNVVAPITLATHCNRLGIPNVHFSSDLVFDGQSARPYFESDPVAPLNVYGRSKAAADAALLTIPTALVIRTAAFFSPFDSHNFAIALVESLRRHRCFGASTAHRITPTYVPHLSNFVLDILIDGEAGLWHVSNGEELSWHEFALKLAIACQLDAELIKDANKAELGWLAERPLRTSLASQHGRYLPNLDQAIQSFAREILTASPTAKKACP